MAPKLPLLSGPASQSPRCKQSNLCKIQIVPCQIFSVTSCDTKGRPGSPSRSPPELLLQPCLLLIPLRTAATLLFLQFLKSHKPFPPQDLGPHCSLPLKYSCCPLLLVSIYLLFSVEKKKKKTHFLGKSSLVFYPTEAIKSPHDIFLKCL